METSFEGKLKELIMINSKARIVEADITDESDFINEFGYNSISIINLIVDIETEFGIDFEDDKLSFETIGNYKALKNYLESRITVR